MNLPPIDAGGESIGQRLARIRKERGFTQVELAEKIGIIQSLVSSYESDALRLSADMAVRFAAALEVSVDELLRSRPARTAARQPSRKVLRRLERIEALPKPQQNAVLKSIDLMLKGIAS